MKRYNRMVANDFMSLIEETETNLIIPVVAVVQGVLNGEFVNIKEFVPEKWEGVPIPNKHPKNEESIAIPFANSGQESLGVFKNAKIEKDKMKGELWIEKEKLELAENADVKESIERGKLEVSTAYTAYVSDKKGTYNGKPYDGEQFDLEPDHIAVLPNMKGACSWQDGCGAPRINSGKEIQVRKTFKEKFFELFQNSILPTTDLRELKENQMSFGAITESLYDSFEKDVWISEVYDSFFIYKEGDTWRKRNYEIIEDTVKISENDVEVNRVIQYIEKEMYKNAKNKPNKGVVKMEKAKVDLLINCENTKFTEDHREFLSNASDEMFDVLKAEVKEVIVKEKVTQNDDGGEDVVVDNKKQETLTKEDVQTIVTNALSGSIGEAVAKAITANAEQKEKAEAVAYLSTNGEHGFSKETLEAMDIRALRELYQHVKKVTHNEDYARFGGPMEYQNQEEEMPAPLSVIANQVKEN
jgi:hypothetical protein